MDKVDRIEREVIVAAPIETVWAAITDAEEVAQWFGDVVEIDLRPGGRARFGWAEHDSVTDAVIEIVEPLRRFAYRWASAAGVAVDDGPSTLVEFTLDVVAEGTRLRLVESGFADLPDEIYETSIGENRSGWHSELADLTEFLGALQGV